MSQAGVVAKAVREMHEKEDHRGTIEWKGLSEIKIFL